MLLLIFISLFTFCVFYAVWYFFIKETSAEIQYHDAEDLSAELGNIIRTQRIPTSSRSPNIPEQNPNAEYAINLLVGKYNMTSPNHIDFTRVKVYEILDNNPKIKLDDLKLVMCQKLIYEDLPELTRLLLAQYIINKSTSNQEILGIYEYVINTASNPAVPSVIRMNALDILNLSNNTKYMNIAKQVLEMLRVETDRIEVVGGGRQAPIEMIERNIRGRDDVDIQRVLLTQFRRAPAKSKKPQRTIYQDSQNIHTSTINNSVLSSANNLVKLYSADTSVSKFDYNLLNTQPPHRNRAIQKSIHRIITDPSKFKYNMTLFSVYQALLKHINQHSQKDDLNVRLLDELYDMSGLCATGHLSRMIMVLQGFDDNEADGTAVEIDISTEVYAKISHLVQTEISKEENVRVMDSMFKDNNLLFLEFVRDVVNSNIPEIHREYADIHKETEGRGKINGEILTAVIKYTGVGDSSGKYQIIDKGEVSELILT